MPLAFAFGGPADWIILFIVALVVLGPQKLPEVGRQLGKALREFRKIADEVTGATQSVREDLFGVTAQLKDETSVVKKHLSLDGILEDNSSKKQTVYDQEASSKADISMPDIEARPAGGLKLSTSPKVSNDDDRTKG